MKFNLFLFFLYFVPSLTAQVGIGTTNPVSKVHVSGDTASPSKTGSSQNSLLRLSNTSDASVLDLGIHGTTFSWVQPRLNTNYSTNQPLFLNPNGGSVIIGNNSNIATLSVGGTITASGTIRSSQSGQLLNSVYLTETDLGISNTISNNSTTATDVVSYNYTPVSTNSRIWIKLSANYEIGGNTSSISDEVGSQISVGGSTIQEKRQFFSTGSSGNGNRSVNVFPISAVYDNTSSSTLNIKVSIKRTAGDDQTNVFSDLVFSIMEIAD
jgi:hypothetical protein